jgi:hypothetical protein
MEIIGLRALSVALARVPPKQKKYDTRPGLRPPRTVRRLVPSRVRRGPFHHTPPHLTPAVPPHEIVRQDIERFALRMGPRIAGRVSG